MFNPNCNRSLKAPPNAPTLIRISGYAHVCKISMVIYIRMRLQRFVTVEREIDLKMTLHARDGKSNWPSTAADYEIRYRFFSKCDSVDNNVNEKLSYRRDSARRPPQTTHFIAKN